VYRTPCGLQQLSALGRREAYSGDKLAYFKAEVVEQQEVALRRYYKDSLKVIRRRRMNWTMMMP
jgi:hypothetical protein